jgi:hypothetical protein
MSGGSGWRKSSWSTTNGCLEAFCMEWRKSSHCSNGSCVEVGVARKSSHSQENGCVEVEGLPEGWVALRDNERPDEVIRVRPESWRAFVLGAKDGEFALAQERKNAPPTEVRGAS